MMPFMGCPTGQELLRRAEQHGESDGLEQHVRACAVCAAAFERSTEEACREAGNPGPALANPYLAEPECEKVRDALLAAPVPPLDDEGPTVSEKPPPNAGSLTGLTLGEYQLGNKLGQGGMGDVYRARHLLLGKDRAVKVIRNNAIGRDAAAKERFLREISTGGKLEHANIVSVVDAREDQGELFMVMELLDGCDAAALVEGGRPLPVAEACEIIRQAALGLQHAHEKGYIHRDVKPSNVFVSASGVVKILDLGLARLREASSSGQPRTVGLVGTPDYMAPEQCQSSRLVDVRADLYSLGCTLFHLLTGRPPFAGEESHLVRMRQQCETPPPALRSLRAEVPAEVEALVGRLLEKDPGKRFQTAAEVTKALEPFAGVGRLPELVVVVKADGPGPEEAPAKTPGRSRTTVALVNLLHADHLAGSLTRVLLVVGIALGVLLLGRMVMLVMAAILLLLWVMGPSPGLLPRLGRVCAEVLVVAVAIGATLWLITRPVATPLKGFLDARMTRQGDRLRRNVAIADPAARPLRPGDEIRVYAELNRPAYVYLVWIDTAGKVTPMYPWIDGDWTRRAAEEKATVFKLPQIGGSWKVWKMDPGPRGLETMVLLCRDEPLATDEDLQGRLGEFGRQLLEEQDLDAVMWFENGDPVLGEPERGPNARPVEGGNTLERVNREVQQRVKGLFGYTRAITYVNEGDRP